MKINFFPIAVLALPLASLPATANETAGARTAEAGQLTVDLQGVDARAGTIWCSLYASDKGFPMDASAAEQTVKANRQVNKATCHFRPKAAGSYAVAIGHDENGNQKVDTNFLGIPKEGWATSNDVKPAFRAPTFAESKFQVGGEQTTITARMHY